MKHRIYPPKLTTSLIAQIVLILVFVAQAWGAPDQDDIDSLLINIIERIYLEDYTDAAVVAQDMIATHTGHPGGYFMMAIVSLKEGFFLKDYERYYKTSFKWLDQAIDVSGQWIKDEPKSAYAHFFAGGAYGYQAALYARQKKWIKTGYSALRGIRYLEKAAKLDSSLTDIYFGLGLYHVVAGNQQGIVKLVQKLLPIPNGDEQLGVDYLNRAREKGNFTRLAAISALAFSYIHYEKKYREAANLLDLILSDYPENLEFHTMRTNALFYLTLNRNQEHDLLLAALNKTRRLIADRRLAFYPWWLHKFDFMEGYVHFMAGNYGDAQRLLQAYCQRYGKRKQSYLTALGYLTLGKVADLRGQRRDAISAYKKVSKFEAMGNERETAEILLDAPFLGETPGLRFQGGMTDLPDRP